MISQSVLTNPIPLLAIKNKNVLRQIDSYLPYSSAFEVECMQQTTFDVEAFMSIPDIMDVNCDSYEQRFRFPSGLKGLVCLYNICEQLKLNSELDPGAGIHYHVDCTDIWTQITDSYVSSSTEWILEELDTWHPEYTTRNRGYTGFGTFSGGWLKFNDLHTLEFRVGEMSFDYEVLAKRVIHANDIVRRFKTEFLTSQHKIDLENQQKELKSLREQKGSLETSRMIFTDVAKEVVKSRKIKL